jgi:hypothetical protein
MKRAILAEKKFSWKVPVAVSPYQEFSSDLFYYYPSVVCTGSFFSGFVLLVCFWEEEGEADKVCS